MKLPRTIGLPLIAFFALANALASSGPADCSSELCRLVGAGRLPDLRWPDFPDYVPQIRRFYESSGYSFAWIDRTGVTRSAKLLIEVLKDAESKGLNPEDYDASRWSDRIKTLDVGAANSANPPADAVRFDLALTVSVLRYVSDLRFGKKDPGIFRTDLEINQEKNGLVSFIRDRLVDGSDPNSALEIIEPPYEGYRRTLAVLQHYIALANQPPIEPLPSQEKPVNPGKPYLASTQLAAFLSRLGDLPADATISPNGVYTGALVDAVKHFQSRHGLDTDGRIGKATVAALNTPIEMRIRQLQLTLERWRWMPHTFPVPPVVVNIPEFELRALDANFATTLEMKVVVGKAARLQTPLLSAQMTSIGFWPYWDVPLSIQHKELIPKIVKDRSYLAKNSFEVVNTKREVITSGDIDDDVLARLRASNLLIRQVPGPKNALGLIKFDFPNPFDIYMHDTPATALFADSRRDFSHGCIRLEKPEDFAQWVLRDTPGWSSERIHKAVEGGKTFEVRLAQPIPVLIVYATAVPLANGEVRFLEDIYGLDAQLEALLAKGYPYQTRTFEPTSAAPARHPRE